MVLTDRLVFRFLLTRGHHLPEFWAPEAAEALLRLLLQYLLDTGSGPWTVDEYEEALQDLLEAGHLAISSVRHTGPLLEQFCEYLMDKKYIAGLTKQATETTLATSQSTARSSVHKGAAPARFISQHAPSSAGGLSRWDEVEAAFFRERETGYRRFEGATPQNYRTDLRQSRQYFFEHHTTITTEALNAYVRWLELDARTPKGEHYKRTSIARRKNTLRSFLGSSPAQAEWPGLDLNVLGSKKRDKVASNPHRALGPADLRVYETAAKELPLARRILVMLPLEAGLRAEDTGSLRWSNVDFANGRLDYVAQKTGKRVKVPVAPEFCKLLSEYRQGCPSEEFLFPGRMRPALSGKIVTHWVGMIAASAGIARAVTAHDLRVTFTTYQYYHNEVDLITLQGWLEHNDINTTRAYVDPEAGWSRRRMVREIAA